MAARVAKVDVGYTGPGAVVTDGETGDPFDCMLNQVNISANSNKFYVIQLVKSPSDEFFVVTRWGRVGERGARAVKSHGKNRGAAVTDFKTKFRTKTKVGWDVRHVTTAAKPGAYSLIEMSYSSDDEDGTAASASAARPSVPVPTQPCSLPVRTRDLIELIFSHDMFKQAMAHYDYDADKTPLGKLKRSQLERGTEVLDRISAAIVGQAGPDIIATLSSEFYTIIPHAFGRGQRPPSIATEGVLQRKHDMIQALLDVVQAHDAIKQTTEAAARESEDDQAAAFAEQPPSPHPTDQMFATLGNQITPLDRESAEWDIIERYTENTMGHRQVKIVDVFSVLRDGDAGRFAAHAELGNRKLLWHGTNIGVVVAILQGGLRIMPHSGGRVGRGLYFASENGKSAGYVGCCTWRGKSVGVMFLNEVALGTIHQITRDDPSIRAPPVGFNSVHARGRVEPDATCDEVFPDETGREVIVPVGKPIPSADTTVTSFENSEYLVYDETQVLTKYMLLLEFL